MGADRQELEALKKLGLKLRAIREKKGWTLEDAEEHGYKSWQHLQKLESGKNITVLTLMRLSKLYKIRLTEIFKEM